MGTSAGWSGSGPLRVYSGKVNRGCCLIGRLNWGWESLFQGGSSHSYGQEARSFQCGPSTGLLPCPYNMAPLRERSSGGERGVSHSALYDLISKVRQPFFHHTPCMSSKSPAHVQGEGTGPNLLKGGGSKNLWPNFKTIPCINLPISLQITNAFAF